MLSPSSLGIFVALLASVFFGAYPPLARASYAAGANVGLVVLATTFGRALLLLFYACARGYRLKQIFRFSKAAAFSGFMQAVSIFGIIASLKFIPGPISITIIFSHTLMLLVIMRFKGELVVTPLLAGVTLVALLGIALVVDIFSNMEGINITGVVLAGIAAVATATRVYSFGKQVKTTPDSIVGAQVFAYASLFSLLVLFWQTPVLPTSFAGFTSLALCVASLGIGSICFFYGISLIGSFKFSLFTKLEPLFTCLYSYLILSETLHASQYLGIALVLGSLVLYQLVEGRKS